jgi:hypothetical protein
MAVFPFQMEGVEDGILRMVVRQVSGGEGGVQCNGLWYNTPTLGYIRPGEGEGHNVPLQLLKLDHAFPKLLLARSKEYAAGRAKTFLSLLFISHCTPRARICYRLRSQGIHAASLCCQSRIDSRLLKRLLIRAMAGRYDNPFCRTGLSAYIVWRNRFLGFLNV